jgi:putative ABC transport system ATP-binding protein
MAHFIEFKNVSKVYKTGTQAIIANDNLSFYIEEGELCVILGPSGAGKTTVLNLLGGMESVTEGDIFLDDQLISRLNDRQLTNYRRNDVGFVFQFYNLMPNLTAIENIELALEISKDPLDPKMVLEAVGLKDRMNNFPPQLSGGEQQRVSIARAIAKNPKILLCDEPTGALDYQTGKSILSLLQKLSREQKKTVIIITHNSALVGMADRVITMKNGKAISNEVNENPIPVSEIEW